MVLIIQFEWLAHFVYSRTLLFTPLPSPLVNAHQPTHPVAASLYLAGIVQLWSQIYGQIMLMHQSIPRANIISDYLCNCKSQISDAMEVHCLLAVKIVHHHANGRFDWLISGHQSVNPSREAISGKYKRFTFVHPERWLCIISYQL